MLSCNARGLWDKLKRKTIFNKILCTQYDIIFNKKHTAPQILKTHGIKIGWAKLSIIMMKIMQVAPQQLSISNSILLCMILL